MKNNLRLNPEELKKYIIEGDQSYELDFSRIPFLEHEGILTSLVKIGKNGIKKLIISLDLYFQIHKEELNSSHYLLTQLPKKISEPFQLQNSAYKNIKNCINDVLIALSHILPRTESLKIFVVKSMILNKNELIKLTEIIKKCKSLSNFGIYDCPLYDDGFQKICSSLKKKGLKEFYCERCRISDDSIHILRDFINFNYNIQKEAEEIARLNENKQKEIICLKKISLKGNSLSYHSIIDISDLFIDFPILYLDLRDNCPIDSILIDNIQKTHPHIKILISSDSNFKNNKKNKFKKKLVNQEDEIILAPDLKIVGKRANEFKNYFFSIVNSVEKLKAQTS